MARLKPLASRDRLLQADLLSEKGWNMGTVEVFTM